MLVAFFSSMKPWPFFGRLKPEPSPAPSADLADGKGALSPPPRAGRDLADTSDILTGKARARTSAREEYSAYTSLASQFSGYLSRRRYIDDVSDQGTDTLYKIAKFHPEWFLEFLFDREPLLSTVLEKYIDLTVSEFSVQVTKSGRAHEGAQTYLTKALSRMAAPDVNGYQIPFSLRGALRKMQQYLFVRKAVALEVVFSEEMQPTELVVIDPLSITFKGDPNEAGRFKPVQRQHGGGDGDIDLDIPNFIWVPHSTWGDPYPRNPLVGVIKKVLSMMQLQQDLELVIHKAAWPRLKIGYELASLRDMMPAAITEEADQVEWLATQIDTLVARYADLEADDNVAFAKDISEVSYLELHNTAGEIFSPEQLMRALEARILDAADTLTTTIGRSAFSGEGANALDGLVQAAVWTGMRQTTELAISRVLSLMVRVGMGVVVDVDFRFEEIVLEPRAKLEMWIKQALDNNKMCALMGGISEREMQEEARRLSHRSGPVPSDAEVDRAWVHDTTSGGVDGIGARSPAAEAPKEAKRKDTNRDRRSTGTKK